MERMESLPGFLPGLENALSEQFYNVHCTIEEHPTMSEAPFKFIDPGFHLYLMQGEIGYRDGSVLMVRQVAGGEVIHDKPDKIIHVIMEGLGDWRSLLVKYFYKTLGTDWIFIIMETIDGEHRSTTVISPKYDKTATSESTEAAEPAAPINTTPVPAKPKTSKKTVVKKTDKSATSSSPTTTTTKVTKSASGTKIVRRRITPKDGSALTNSDTKEKSTIIVKKSSSGKLTKTNAAGTSERAKLETNHNNEASGANSGSSAVDSDNEKSQKHDTNTTTEILVEKSVNIQQVSKTGLQKKSLLKIDSSGENSDDIVATAASNENYLLKARRDDNFDATFTMRMNKQENIELTSNNTTTKLTSKNLEGIPEESEKLKIIDDALKRLTTKANTTSETTAYDNLAKSSNKLDDERYDRQQSSTSSRLSSSSESVDKDSAVRVLSKGKKERRITPTPLNKSQMNLKPSCEIPVQVLQQVFKKFSYKELGELRLVHPYWDELCGQALNQAYYDIVKRANELLTDCQRRVPVERKLNNALSLLTNLQVHILNPVDVLRPAMDEGVCCFPYGELLDKICEILDSAERIMNGEYELTVNWKPVAEMARLAQIHYKTKMESIMEEKLGDIFRIKAMQQIQRIDSFMIDATVSKLQKAAHMARDDIEWEIEQLRQQNTQLKKDNRELKKDYMLLESRVQILEGKLKTIARLLQ